MKQTPALRALTFLGSTLLLLAIFEACSNDDSTLTVDGPPSISITKITVGPGTDAGQACGNPIGLTLDINNWLLKQPGLCLSAPQCGQVRVTLTRGSDGSVLATRVAVSAAVDLTALGSLETGSYNVEAELIDDSGNVFAITDAGSSSAQETFQVNPAVDCPSSSTGGAPGAGGSPPSDAGAGGFGAAAPDSDTAGSVGVIAGAGGA